jgi:hypothetical protein
MTADIARPPSTVSEIHSNTTASTMAALAEKLREIGGVGKLDECVWRIRVRLNWHSKPASTVRHMLYRERRPSVEEAQEIEAAHLRWCAERVEANRAESQKLFVAMREAIAAMEASDPEFYAPHLDAVRELLLQGGNGRSQGRSED